MIEEPLQRVLERLDAQAAGMVGSYMDPLVLFLGFLGWGARIWRLKFRSDDDDDRGRKDQPEPEPPPKEPARRGNDRNPKDEEEIWPTADQVPADIRDNMGKAV